MKKQSPHHPPFRVQCMVALHEFHIHTHHRQVGSIVGLREKSSVVPVDSRHDQFYVLDFGLQDFCHLNLACPYGVSSAASLRHFLQPSARSSTFPGAALQPAPVPRPAAPFLGPSWSLATAIRTSPRLSSRRQFCG